MNMTESILSYRQYLKRRNYSALTIKNYLHRVTGFIRWAAVPVELVSSVEVEGYIRFLLGKNIAPHTINCHLTSIRGFYDYLDDESDLSLKNPVVRGMMLREPYPLPRYLRDNDVELFLQSVPPGRDRAMFMLMLRCGLRVQEIANLTLDVIDYRRSRILVKSGKGAKDRVVYISNDAAVALAEYLRKRPKTRERKVFLVQKGRRRGKPISVRAIQNRIELYSRKSGVRVSCHRLRHTMATQLLNSGADLVSIQELLGHTRIKTTQRYSKISNIKVQRDYFNAMEIVMNGTVNGPKKLNKKV